MYKGKRVSHFTLQIHSVPECLLKCNGFVNNVNRQSNWWRYLKYEKNKKQYKRFRDICTSYYMDISSIDKKKPTKIILLENHLFMTVLKSLKMKAMVSLRFYLCRFKTYFK